MWHGIPRKDIPWFPSVDTDTCIGCTLCYTSCGRGVYEMQNNKAVAVNAMSCMVGCSTCGTVCPVQAIAFPDRDMIWRLEREEKIFKVVRQEAEEKMAKQDALKARAAAEDAVAKLTMRVRFEIAGEFGEKRFLIQLGEMIKEGSYDFVNLRLDIPTVRGVALKTPSFMSFEVTSTEQDDIQAFLPEVRDLIRLNELTLVSEKKL
ncbi:MAG: ferredoxin family protein [Anaerolineae bacterium]|nr:ferredoxin family protein [Anaerolineae bacterium]